MTVSTAEDMQAQAWVTAPTGLSAAEVADRSARGLVNRTDDKTSRSLADIVRSNVLTVFNGLLFALFIVVMATGRWQNGLFGLVIVANSAIGVFQEVRAKRTLDQLAILNSPRVLVIRDGIEHDLVPDEVVQDDLVVLKSGDQVIADGLVRTGTGLEIDESLLTGESDPVHKLVGDEVRSGSIVVAGQGTFQAAAVGADSYASQLVSQVRRFTITKSELVAGTNKILKWISVTMLVVGPVLLWSQFRSHDNESWQQAMTGTVAALVGMVPEGLVLLTSLAFLLATVSLARKNTLVQELPAVEVLARVDIVCLDKTGTLTYGDIEFDEVIDLSESHQLTRDGSGIDTATQAPADVAQALALMSNTGDANATAVALAAHFTHSDWTATDSVPFSSARKWQAVVTVDHGTWVLGAPEMVLPDAVVAADRVSEIARERANEVAALGRRVLLLAQSPADQVHPESEGSSTAGGDEKSLPAQLQPKALVVLAERIREDAAQTLQYFTEQGVALKVISGDNPRTVGAVAAAVGLLKPTADGSQDAVDARTLPTDLDELADVLETHSVFGRVTPQQKRAIVAALQRRGHVVAMTGDGVNDALALKDADIGVAMGNGAAATRAVAQLVLLDSKFAHLPDVVAEGRRVIANIERAANLFLVKNIYSVVLALITAATVTAYPLAPIQLTLISSITIGIPGFLLALGPNTRRYIPGFLTRVLRLAIPVGIVTAVGAYSGYHLTRLLESGASVDDGRTTATIIVLIISLWTLMVSARPVNGWKVTLVAGMAALVAGIVFIPVFGHDIFLLNVTAERVGIAAIIGAIGAVLVEVSYRAITLLTKTRG